MRLRLRSDLKAQAVCDNILEGKGSLGPAPPEQREVESRGYSSAAEGGQRAPSVHRV